MSFKDITLKEIGNETSFSRPTIYNYYQTKEEIFLALFEREYVRWNEELQTILRDNRKLTKAELAEKLAASLANRQQLLKLLAMNNYDMEENSREELLTSFKVAYGESIKNVCSILTKFCPKKSDQEIQNLRRASAYCRERMGSDKIADYDGVDCIVKLLKQCPEQNREEEFQQLFPNDAFC